MINKSKLTDVERDLVEGLGEFLADLKESDKPLANKYTFRRVVLDLEPMVYEAANVKATRKLLRCSQGLFAQFLGVSVKTVRGWEQGKPVNDMAARFMDEIQRDPDYWRNRLSKAIKIRNCNQPS